MDTSSSNTPVRRTASGLPIRTSLSGEQLERHNRPDVQVRRHGQTLMSPIFAGFLECDDLGQAVMTDFHQGRGNQRMLRKALDDGIESVEDAPESLIALFAELDAVPKWVDWEQLRRGAIAYWRAGPLVALAFTSGGNAGGDSGIGATRPQAFTGRFEEKAYTRAAETFRWLMAVTTPGGMHRHEDGFKLSVRVRILHAAVRAACVEAEGWQWDDWGIPISSTDQAVAISYVFTTTMVDSFRKLGVRYTDQELEDIYALWRYIGHISGVPEHLLPTNEADSRRLNDIWWSMDRGPDDYCRKLVHSLIELATPDVPSPDQPIDVFPKVVDTLLTPRRIRALLFGLIRYLHSDRLGDALQIPDTKWKHAGHGIRVIWTAVEGLRRTGLVDDERIGHNSRELFNRALGARPGQPVVAPPEEIGESVSRRRYSMPARRR